MLTWPQLMPVTLTATYQHRGGFPNRGSKFQGKVALILQDLFPLPSRDGYVFSVTLLHCTKPA